MRTPEERSAFFAAIERGEDPGLPPDPESAPLDIGILLRHLSGMLDEAQGDRVLRVVSRDPEERRHLVEVGAQWEWVRSLRPSDLMELRGGTDLQAQVAAAWLSILEESLLWSLSLGFDRGRVAIEGITRAASVWPKAKPYLRAIVRSSVMAPQGIYAAYRGDGPISIETHWQNEELVVQATVPAEWEGRDAFVVLRGEMPILLGTATVTSQAVSLSVSGVRGILGATDLDRIEVGVSDDTSLHYKIFPRDDGLGMRDELDMTALPTVTDGQLYLSLSTPAAFATKNAGKTLHIFMELMPGVHQFLGAIPVAESDTTLRVALPNSSTPDGPLMCRLVYSVL